MASIVFVISITSGSILVLLTALSFLTGRFQFWPPPSKNSWQYLLFWTLFRIMLIGLLVLCFIDFNSLSAYSKPNYILGGPLIILGFGLAIFYTSYLGWDNAHGKSMGNPIYVLSIIGMFGIGVVANSLFVDFILLLWALMYLIAPFCEEPWLEKQYGLEFTQYMLAINAVMFIAEAIIGWIAESTGLIADSLDMLADAAVYGLSLYAVGLGVQKQVKAATVSGVLQIILGFGVLLEVLRRAVYGSEPESLLMIGVGAVALISIGDRQ